MDKSDENIRRLINNPSFVAWSLGEADEVTAAYWDEWISRSSDHRHFAVAAQQLISEFKIEPGQVSHDLKFIAWEQLDERIAVQNDPSTVFVYNLPSRQKGNGWFYSLAGAAIILIIIMSVAGYWRHVNIQEEAVIQEPQTKSVSTDFGEQKEIQLTDGSKITLNANSSITYYDGWVHQQKVKVDLTGEALFAVEERSSPGDPAFQVSTDDGDIKVLGTRFAVSTRKEETQIVLEKGAVEINQANNSDKNIQLKPDEMARFNSTERVQIQQVNTQVYTSWAKHLFVFDQTPLAEAAKRIEHTFGVQVKIAETSMKKRKLSGAVESTNLEVLTSALEKTFETSISRKGDQIIIGREVKSDVRQ